MKNIKRNPSGGGRSCQGVHEKMHRITKHQGNKKKEKEVTSQNLGSYQKGLMVKDVRKGSLDRGLVGMQTGRESWKPYVSSHAV